MSAETRCDCWNRTTSSIGEPRTAVWRERAAILYANHPRVRCLFSGNSRDHEIEKVNAASRKKTPVQCQICLKILKIKHKIWITGTVARTQALLILRWKSFKTTCTLCSAVAYCCGAVAPRAVAALLGRFLPRLGPLVHSSGPFFLAARYPALSLRAKREPGMTGFQVGVVSQTGLERTLDRGWRDFIPPRPGTVRDRQRERSRARPLAPRNRRPLAQIAAPFRDGVRPYRSRG